MGRDRKLDALLCLSSWCLVVVVWFFLAVPWVYLHFVIVVFPDHTHLLFSAKMPKYLDRELHPEGILYSMMFCNYIIEDAK